MRSRRVAGERRQLRYPSVKAYHSIRTAHLERALAAPASFLCHTFRYDLDHELSDRVDVHQVSTARRLWLLATSDIATAEVNEPLMRHALPFTVGSVAAIRLNAALRRRKIVIGSYAIENLDPFGDIDAGRWRRRLRRRAERRLARWVTGHLDRLVFGTADAHQLYRSLLDDQLHRIDTVEIPALPAPCSCPDAERRPAQLLFVGALDERKGIRPLMQAWPQIKRLEPASKFVIVGKGTLEAEVRRFADGEPDVTFHCDPPRDEVHHAFREASVLALLSQKMPGWREQVGLPIVEGLAHGCRVLTTDQTGLASWLESHEHEVIATAAGPEVIASAVIRGFSHPTGDPVLDPLPSIDGRLAADAWLRDSRTGQ